MVPIDQWERYIGGQDYTLRSNRATLDDRLRDSLTTIQNHFDSEKIFSTKLMYVLPDEICNNTQRLKSISCAELIRATSAEKEIKSASALAGAEIITRVCLPQICSRNETKLSQGITVNKANRVHDDVMILTTDSLCCLFESGKRKHLLKLASVNQSLQKKLSQKWTSHSWAHRTV